MTKILIAIPTARYIEPDTFKSIYDLQIPAGVTVDFQYFFGYRIDQVRNLIADWVVKGYDYLFAIDSDMILPSDTLVKLFNHNKSIVTGLYRGRNDQQILYEIYDLNQQRITELPDQEMFEIGGCGFGCVLVKKQVFESIGYPQFEYHPALDHNNTFSEDNDFCKKARKLNYQIYCDQTITCGHIGKKIFELTPQETVQVNVADSDPVPEVNVISELSRFEELREMKLIPQSTVDACNKLSAGFQPKVIWDLGSCVLHWTDMARAIWPNTQYVCVDAMETDALHALYNEGLNLSVDRYILGKPLYNESGTRVTWNENVEHPGGNSIYQENRELSPRAEELFPKDNVKSKKTLALKDVELPIPDLIKMDIQGAELPALEGMGDYLAKAKYLICELQTQDYNIGAAKAPEVIKWLGDRGWILIDKFGGSPLGVDADYMFYNTQRVT